MVFGQLLSERQRLAELGLRRRRFARVHPAGCRGCRWLFARLRAELGDGGLVFGQLLNDHQCLAGLGLRLRQPARVPQQGGRVVAGERRQQRGEVVVAVRQEIAELG